MAIKFPKLNKRDDEFTVFRPEDDMIGDDMDLGDDDMMIRGEEDDNQESGNGAFSGINESAVSLKLMTPKDFSEAKKVADSLIAKSSVVINVENLVGNDIVRFMDFLMGVIYVINGNMRHVSKTTIIVTPNNVGVEGDGEEDMDN